jgi:N-acetylneuraminic acid mutarotase
VIRLHCALAVCLLSAGLQAGQSITIASPRGGEFFLVGQTQVVRLDDRTKFKSVGVELSRDGGTTFESLGTIDNAGDKSKRNALSFTVTGPASGNCVVRVRAALGSNQIVAVTGAFVIASPGAGPLQPSGAAGGDLSGTYPNPTIANNVVSVAKVTSGAASNGYVLQANGSGGADWALLPASPTTLPPNGNAGGDLSGTYPNPTVATVGGQTAASVAGGTVAVSAATNTNTASTIVRRDPSGNFSAGTITATLNGSATNFIGSLTGNVTGTQGATVVSVVGGQTAANVGSGVLAANAATSANTASSIVKRDVNGAFSGGLIESTSGGLKFPDATVQTTAAIGVPAGFVIMGTTSTAPTGYTSTGQKVETTWIARASMPTIRVYCCADTVNGKIYAMGGTFGGLDLAINEEYDPATNTWSIKAPIPAIRSEHAIGVVNGKIYVVGGRAGGVNYSTVVLEYDPVANSWATKAPMPTGRNFLGVGVVNGKLYAIGGTAGGPELDVVEEFDPVANTWATKVSMPTARHLFGTGVANGKIYALCGTSQTASPAAVNEEFDPVLNTWSSKAAVPVARNSLAACGLNGKIYSIGGSSNSNEVQEYNPALNTWQQRVSTVAGRELHVAAVVNQSIFAIGGVSASALTGLNEEYSPATFYVFQKD